jgi:hypothetical protein
MVVLISLVVCLSNTPAICETVTPDYVRADSGAGPTLLECLGASDRVRQAGVDSSAFEVAIGHAAWGGIWAGSGSAAGGASSAMASTCM